MSTPLVLTLFTALTVAVIAGIMGAAMWGRNRSTDEPAYETVPDSASFFEDAR
jgi:Flp pilus assembly protein CpaB